MALDTQLRDSAKKMAESGSPHTEKKMAESGSSHTTQGLSKEDG